MGENTEPCQIIIDFAGPGIAKVKSVKFTRNVTPGQVRLFAFEFYQLAITWLKDEVAAKVQAAQMDEEKEENNE